MIEKLIQRPVASGWENVPMFTSPTCNTELVNKINEIIDALNKLSGCGQEIFEPVRLPWAVVKNKLGCGQEVKTPGFEPDSLGSIPSVPASKENK